MIFYYIFTPLLLKLSLYLPGYVFNEFFLEKKYFKLNKIILGFLLLIFFGTFISIFSLNFIDNQNTWIVSYFLITIISFITQ